MMAGKEEAGMSGKRIIDSLEDLIAFIQGDDSKATIYEPVKPESLGWVRSPEHDDAPGGKAYEKPDGAIHVFPSGRRAMVMVKKG